MEFDSMDPVFTPQLPGGFQDQQQIVADGTDMLHQFHPVMNPLPRQPMGFINSIIIAGIAFGINSGAYVAEIVRAGINAVPEGQLEAAESLGMPFNKAMFSVILPQAIRNILPALCNEGISLLKETSIAGYIGIVDVTKAAMLIRSQTYSAFVPLIGVAIIYLVIALILQYLVGRLERRLNNAYR